MPRGKGPGRTEFDPNQGVDDDGLLLVDKAIGARRAMSTIEDIARGVYGVNVRTVERHMARCALRKTPCRFCRGMDESHAKSRMRYTGLLHSYAVDAKSVHHYKALALMATHAPGSPLRQKTEVSTDPGGPVDLDNHVPTVQELVASMLNESNKKPAAKKPARRKR